MLSRIIPPTNWPVSLEEAKDHLNVTFDDDDGKIDIYRKAASESSEMFTGLAFYNQTLDYHIESFPTNNLFFEIPRSPILEVAGVFYNDGTAEQPWSADAYRIVNTNGFSRVYPVSSVWPTASGAVRVRFTAGMVDEDASPVTGEIPWLIKAAILLTTGTLYASREDVVVGTIVSKLPQAARDLLRDFRIHTAIG